MVLAIDPPVSVGARADACGMIIAGRKGDHAFVLQDSSVQGLSPADWARRACAVAASHRVHLVIAEANQGGEMVREMLKIAGMTAPVRLVHATRSKRARAEPVSALYEQGRVHHCGVFADLEAEMTSFGAEGASSASPDRMDALVWAVHALLIAQGTIPAIRTV